MNIIIFDGKDTSIFVSVTDIAIKTLTLNRHRRLDPRSPEAKGPPLCKGDGGWSSAMTAMVQV